MKDSVEKIKCKDVVVGDVISPENNNTCKMKVVKIEEDQKILGFLKARRLYMELPNGDTWAKNYGPAKPMKRLKRT